MRVWIDISNSPQVPFFRPLIALLRGRGHDVEVTTRDYAQTLELLELHGIPHDVVGPRHGGAGALGKARAMARAPSRAAAFRARAAVRHRTLARVARAAARRALARDSVRVRLRLRVRADAARARLPRGATRRRSRGDPAGPARPLGARAAKVARYPGLKEEYYLYEFAPDGVVLDELGLDPEPRARRRPHAARGLPLPPPRQPALRRRRSSGWAPTRRCRPSSCRAPPSSARRSRARAAVARRAEHAVDAQSLVALADLVVSAGGTMNREAVALGVPVWTTFAGRMGAVDEALVARRTAADPALGGRPRARRRATSAG